MPSLAKICKNTIMVCGVLTALTGVAGGIVELIKNSKDIFSDDKTPISTYEEYTPLPESMSLPESIPLDEQHIRNDIEEFMEKNRIKNMEEDGIQVQSMNVEEPDLTESITSIWELLLGIGMMIVSMIIGGSKVIGWIGMRKANMEKGVDHENTGGR